MENQELISDSIVPEYPKAKIINGNGKILLKNRVLYILYTDLHGHAKEFPLNKNGSFYSCSSENGETNYVSINGGSFYTCGSELRFEKVKLTVNGVHILDGTISIYYPV